MFRIKDCICYYTSDDYRFAKRSLRESKRCINSVKGFNSRTMHLEYYSPRKLETLSREVNLPTSLVFFEEQEIQAGAGLGKSGCSLRTSFRKSYGKKYEQSIYISIEEATRRLRKNRSFFTTYDKCSNADYILVHFPFFAGRVALKLGPLDECANTMWWHGEYRDLSLRLCGNVRNLVSAGDDYSREGYLWDPSSDEASIAFFANVSSVLENGEDMSKISQACNLGSEEIERALCAINDGTRRGYDQGVRYGWRNALIRCDYVSRDSGKTMIFGSPIWVTSPCRIISKRSQFGYGWYYLGEDRGNRVFAEWNGKWTGKYGVEQRSLNHLWPQDPLTSNMSGKVDGYLVDEIPSSVSCFPETPSFNHLKATWFTPGYFKHP